MDRSGPNAGSYKKDKQNFLDTILDRKVNNKDWSFKGKGPRPNVRNSFNKTEWVAHHYNGVKDHVDIKKSIQFGKTIQAQGNSNFDPTKAKLGAGYNPFGQMGLIANAPSSIITENSKSLTTYENVRTLCYKKKESGKQSFECNIGYADKKGSFDAEKINDAESSTV
jgi:hypothetical protein